MKDSAAQTVTRFPPSPTGYLQLGNVRTALFNYLYAKKREGKSILRFEDTDKARSKKEYEDDARKTLGWLGLSFDEEYRQSERTAIYRKYLEKLITTRRAYLSHETSEGERRGEVVRFRNPNTTISFTDVVRGEVSFDTTELGDFVIARSLEEPVYHFAVVADDFDMGVTHVIRGDDHISNTPRQILIQEALGAPRPIYVHVPLILAKDRSKLSKRNGSRAATDYRREGYLPDALLNYVALLGWNPGTEREVFTLEELVEVFDFEGVQKSGAVFNEEKLAWINREHMRKISDETLVEGVTGRIPQAITRLAGYSDERLRLLLPFLRERLSYFGELTALAEKGELQYFFDTPIYTPALLPWKGIDRDDTLRHLQNVSRFIGELSHEAFTSEAIKEKIWGYASEEGRGAVLWPFRVALSGREKSPDPFSIAAVLGKDETIMRLNKAIDGLQTV